MDQRGHNNQRGRGRRGRGPCPTSIDSYDHHHHPESANSNSQIPYGSKDDVSPQFRNRSQPRSVSNNSKHFNHAKNAPKFEYREVRHSPGAKDLSSGVEKLNLVAKVATPSSSEKDSPSFSLRDKSCNLWTPKKGQMANDDAKTCGSLNSKSSPAVDNTSSPVSSSTFKGIPYSGVSQSEHAPLQKLEDDKGFRNSDNQIIRAAFDICPPKSGAIITLKPSLHKQNRAKREEAKLGQSIIELRSGMILLKKHLSFDDQAKIVQECRKLGLGPGGFYEPGYRDGGKLHLKMMCLGKNWDPEKSEYRDLRPTDGAKPPSIPMYFHQLVEGAIEASHSFLRERAKGLNVMRLLPSMSSNICIVNFYTKSGRLGLHQDKDESEESINKCLPVVSFSIGDSAEFLYSDQRDPEKAEKVVLESGDVLIFGGKSRLVFHGVASIITDTAPKALLDVTSLRPGRLNLTFRES